MIAAEIEARFGAYVHERALLGGDARVVVAVSGGGDSGALLALLCETGVIARERLVAAWFDHRLRGDDASRAERDAVAALCARYAVSLEAGAWDAPAANEAAAREARYAFLARVARAHHAGAVVTGHTSDDQVETVLMHHIRGADHYGLAGMRAASTWPFALDHRLELVRPLLEMSREETHAYCETRGIAYVDDASNGDLAYQRNYVRHEVLPGIEASSPGVRRRLLELSGLARRAIIAIAPVVDALIMDAGNGEVRMMRRALRAETEDVARHVYRGALVRLLGDARDFDRRHYAMLARAHDATTGSTFELPRGVVATVDPDAVVLSVGPPGPVSIDVTIEYALPFAGELGGWRIDVVRAEGDGLFLPADAVVRGRRPGDRIQPRGMRGHKKLQDYYVDRKVPRRERDGAPVIACGRAVLWTPFGAAAPHTGAGAAYRIACVREAHRFVGVREQQV